jgi:hypothetical protein
MKVTPYSCYYVLKPQLSKPYASIGAEFFNVILILTPDMYKYILNLRTIK